MTPTHSTHALQMFLKHVKRHDLWSRNKDYQENLIWYAGICMEYCGRENLNYLDFVAVIKELAGWSSERKEMVFIKTKILNND